VSAANLTSTEALAGLAAALVQFQSHVQDGIVQLRLAARRAMDWIEHDRSQYWPREVRKAADAVSEARLALAQAQSTIDPNDQRYCYDERKRLEKAKRRLELAEAKVQAVRRWKVELRKEVEEFEVQAAKLEHFLEMDLPQALAALARMSEALARYTQVAGASEPAAAGEDAA